MGDEVETDNVSVGPHGQSELIARAETVREVEDQ